jgi:hypothetical protein
MSLKDTSHAWKNYFKALFYAPDPVIKASFCNNTINNEPTQADL